MNTEIFKDIPDYEGLYQVSNLGRIKSLKFGKEKILKQQLLKGYYILGLSKNGISKKYKVHQLVAMAFLNHIPCGMELVVDHINRIKSDNRFENLRITTQRINADQKHIKSSSKYIGVRWKPNRNKWYAQIRINGKTKHLGCFMDEYEAHLAYQNALNNLN